MIYLLVSEPSHKKRLQIIQDEGEKFPWKKKNHTVISTYMLPPRSLELSVTTADPIHTITNTSANCGPPSLMRSSELPWRTIAMNVHRSKGPHRSPEMDGTRNLFKMCRLTICVFKTSLSILFRTYLGP